MADTARPLGSLQSLLADNTSKGISPQDMRDVLVSTLLKQVTTTAISYSATSNDVAIIVDATTNAAVITLPTVSSQYTGHLYFVKAINASVNKPYITAGNNINSVSANWTLNSSNEYVTLINTGSDYQVIGTNRYPKMLQTAPANYTATSNAETTICSQTFALQYGGVCRADFKAVVHTVTTTAMAPDEIFKLKINNAEVDNVRYKNFEVTTTAWQGFVEIKLMCLATLGAAATHSITVTRLGGNWPVYPISIEYQKLVYTLYDLG
jgi:hypothetical protein